MNNLNKRPEANTRCIDHPTIRSNSWCGRRINYEWTFMDLATAIAISSKNGRLKACPQCVKKAQEAAGEGSTGN